VYGVQLVIENEGLPVFAVSESVCVSHYVNALSGGYIEKDIVAGLSRRIRTENVRTAADRDAPWIFPNVHDFFWFRNKGACRQIEIL